MGQAGFQDGSIAASWRARRSARAVSFPSPPGRRRFARSIPTGRSRIVADLGAASVPYSPW
ncbi:hypothetical protein GCM10022245_45500 [Streptomyces mayteni]